MIMSTVLSICIPTYNRVSFIERLLSGLLPQVVAEAGRVEVIISDNASTDGTDVLVKSLIEKYGFIKYFRNDDNKGADYNIARAFWLGGGKYIWVLGDDEVVAEGAVGKILHYVTNVDFNLVYIKGCYFKNEFDPRSGMDAKLKVYVFQDSVEFAKQVGSDFTFISSIVVNRTSVPASVEVFCFCEGLETNLVQLGWVFSALKNDGKYLYLDGGLLGVQSGNTGGYRLFTVFSRNLNYYVRTFLADSPRLGAVIENSNLLYFLLHCFFLADRKGGRFLSEDVSAVLADVYRNNWRYRLFLKPLEVLPRALGWIYYGVVKAILAVDRRYFRRLI